MINEQTFTNEERTYTLENVIRDWVEDPDSLQAGSRVLKVAENGSFYLMREVSMKRLGGSFKPFDLAKREAEVLTENEFPGTPNVIDYFEQEVAGDIRRYVVSEWAEGKNLKELVEGGRRFSHSEIIDVGIQIGEILQETGAKGIVHRDVKPSNVMLTEDGKVTLVDFGFLQEIGSRAGGSTVAGTIGYMAPEQLLGKATAQSDLCGLGATLTYLMTDGLEVFEMDLVDLIPQIRPHVQEKVEQGLLSSDLVTICENALQPLPSKRYANASSMVYDLKEIVGLVPKRIMPRELQDDFKREIEEIVKKRGSGSRWQLYLLTILSTMAGSLIGDTVSGLSTISSSGPEAYAFIASYVSFGPAVLTSYEHVVRPTTIGVFNRLTGRQGKPKETTTLGRQIKKRFKKPYLHTSQPLKNNREFYCIKEGKRGYGLLITREGDKTSYFLRQSPVFVGLDCIAQNYGTEIAVVDTDGNRELVAKREGKRPYLNTAAELEQRLPEFLELIENRRPMLLKSPTKK